MMESKEMAMKIAKLLDERKAIDVTGDRHCTESFLCRLFCHGIGRQRTGRWAALVDNVEEHAGAGRRVPKKRRRNSQLWLDPDGLRRCGRQRDDRRDAEKNTTSSEVWGDCESLDDRLIWEV